MKTTYQLLSARGQAVLTRGAAPLSAYRGIVNARLLTCARSRYSLTRDRRGRGKRKTKCTNEGAEHLAAANRRSERNNCLLRDASFSHPPN